MSYSVPVFLYIVMQNEGKEGEEGRYCRTKTEYSFGEGSSCTARGPQLDAPKEGEDEGEGRCTKSRRIPINGGVIFTIHYSSWTCYELNGIIVWIIHQLISLFKELQHSFTRLCLQVLAYITTG